MARVGFGKSWFEEVELMLGEVVKRVRVVAGRRRMRAGREMASIYYCVEGEQHVVRP